MFKLKVSISSFIFHVLQKVLFHSKGRGLLIFSPNNPRCWNKSRWNFPILWSYVRQSIKKFLQSSTDWCCPCSLPHHLISMHNSNKEVGTSTRPKMKPKFKKMNSLLLPTLLIGEWWTEGRGHSRKWRWRPNSRLPFSSDESPLSTAWPIPEIL